MGIRVHFRDPPIPSLLALFPSHVETLRITSKWKLHVHRDGRRYQYLLHVD